MLLILRSKKKLTKSFAEFNVKLSHHLKKAGVPFSFYSFEDIELFMEKDKISLTINGEPLSNWSAVYPRKVGDHKGLSFILATLCANNQITFLDRFHLNSFTTAKIVQVFLFAQNGIPIPKTYHCANYSKKQLQHAVEFLGFPVVVKQANTSQGAGVFLAKNLPALEKTVKRVLENKNEGNVFLQEFIPNDFEYRIFTTGNKVGAAEKKIRLKNGEFRNNISLGAREEFLDIASVKKNILATALKASRVSGIQVAGVDIVETRDGKLFVFEANSCPCLTLDEKISPELASLARYLEECEKDNPTK